MLAILEQLLVIQDRDRRVARLKVEQTRIPQQITAVDSRLSQGSARLEALRQDVKHIEAERKKLEIDADAKRAQIAKHRTQLFQIKSNTEYQALLKEIATLEQQVKDIEDSELELMEKAEQLQPALKEAQAEVKDGSAKAEAEKADLQKRAALIAQELQQLQAEREKLAKDAPPEALDRYDRLMRSKGDEVIVPIRNGNCGGCHLHISPQLIHNAKHSGELTSCDFCGRILYWQAD
jgi:predicted  nucleic acid-binding Zn-ribbon protein